ncbi:MAG: hypothetical protein QOH70_1094 [Blastocatellia bacterium]|nr:hypothetical protein [Blastocatellia bacterium]
MNSVNGREVWIAFSQCYRCRVKTGTRKKGWTIFICGYTCRFQNLKEAERVDSPQMKGERSLAPADSRVMQLWGSGNGKPRSRHV